MNDYLFLKQNSNLNEKLKKIEKTRENATLENTYRLCQALLEYINVQLLVNHFHIQLDDYHIITLIEHYRELDQELYQMMIKINADYNLILEVTDFDIDLILTKIEGLYQYAIQKYGEFL